MENRGISIEIPGLCTLGYFSLPVSAKNSGRVMFLCRKHVRAFQLQSHCEPSSFRFHQYESRQAQKQQLVCGKLCVLCTLAMPRSC